VAAQAWINDIMEKAQIDPTILDNADLDAYAKFQHEAGAIPVDLIRPVETVQAIRQQRAEQEQAEQQAMDAMQLVEGAQGAAKANKDFIETGSQKSV